MGRPAKKPKTTFESTMMPSNNNSQHLDESLDESSADELCPETDGQSTGMTSTKSTPIKSAKPSTLSRASQLSPGSENDIVVKEREGHRLKLVLYNQFRCGKCITSGQDCIVEIGRKGSHVVRCELCIARNQSLIHCTLPFQTLLGLDQQNPHLQYTIHKLGNTVKKNELQAKKEGTTSATTAATPASTTPSRISETRLREAKARLNSLRKACEKNGDKLIASQLEDIILECLSEDA